MSGVSQFYLFITKRYGDNFEQFKRDADTNRNNTIQFNELANYIQKEPTLVPNVSTEDMYTIWRQLDLDIYGNNSESTDHVSENGSLNNNEEIKFNRKIEIYGELSAKICDIISQTIDNDAFAPYNIDRNALEANIIDQVLIICDNDIEKVSDYLKTEQSTTDIKKHTFQQALYCVRDAVCNNMQHFVSGMDYDFDNDNDLKEIIDRYISGFTTTQGCNLNQVVGNIEQIIGAYLNTAQLNVGNYQAPDGFAYDPNDKMNTVQLAALRKHWSDIINAIPADNYREFSSDLYDAAIEGFVNKKAIEWAELNSSEFTSCKKTAQDITNEFITSPEMNTLAKIVDINNICNEAGSFDGEWSDFYDGDDDPKRMASILFYFGGFYAMDRDVFQKFFNDGTFTESLKNAYTDIISNPEKYGLDLNTCTQQELQNAVMEYFKEHLSSILGAMGCDNSETTNALAWDFYGSFMIVDENKTSYGDYDFDDLKASARKLVSYVQIAYKSVPEVMDAISDLELDNIESFDSPKELKDSIDELMEIIRVSASAVYHRLNPEKAGAVIEATVKSVLDEKGVTDKSHRQVCKSWLTKIAERYLDSYKGYRLDIFQKDLNKELKKWFDSPINTLVNKINEDYWNEIKDNEYDNPCEKEELEELRQTLIDIMALADCMGIVLVDAKGNPRTAQEWGYDYGTSEAEELHTLIKNIIEIIKTFTGNMEELSEQHKDGTIKIYVFANGKYLNTTNSIPLISMDDDCNSTGISGSDKNYACNTFASVYNYAKNRVYNSFYAEAEQACKDYGIEFDKAAFDKIFEKSLDRRLHDHNDTYLGRYHVNVYKALNDTQKDVQHNMTEWIMVQLGIKDTEDWRPGSNMSGKL